MKKTVLILAGAIVAPVLVAAPAAVAAEQTMRCSHQLPPRHHGAKLIARWAKEIESQSKGALKVQVYGANSLRNAKQNIPAVARGNIECAFSVNFQWGGTIPEMNVTLRPYTFTDRALLEKFHESEAAKILEAAMLKKGVRNVAWMFITRMSAYTSKDKPLIKPEDFKGVKIRGLNKLVDNGLRALGAAPSAMSGSKVYQALATGVIDAGLTDISAAYSRKYYEVQKYVTASPLFSVFFHAYVNPKWYDGLDAAQKQALAAAGAKLGKWAIEVSDATAAKAPGQLREKGMVVHIHTADEIAAMKKVMAPAFDKAFDSSTGETGKKLMKIMGN